MVKIDIGGFSEVLKNISTLAADLRDEIDAEIEEATRRFSLLAKQSLAGSLSANNNKKTGRLLGSIGFGRLLNASLSHEVFAISNYAAYNEWGTIENVSVPPDLTDIAIKYKGRGIKKHGGMKAKHFFFPQRAIVIPELMNNLNNVIEARLSR
jgi:hypothetical protein